MRTTTITVRAQASLRRALGERAAASGRTVSELVREILEEAVSPRAVAERAGHVRGSLRLPGKGAEAWRERLRERNWRS